MNDRANSFDTIRAWDGSQDRAFEELSYQLLKHTAPEGTRAIRTGNPDGGVEWYATLPDGSEIGWQAKHTHSTDSLLSGMTTSVKRVARERPQLRKLIFVISRNLSTGTYSGRSRSARKRYEDLVAEWRDTIDGAENIEFDVVQSSDLLDLLSLPEHAGRRWFWWDDTVLDEKWLRGKLEDQARAAGEKYRPDLQVDVPIQRDLVAAGFGETAAQHLRRLLKNVTDAQAEMYMYLRTDEPHRDQYAHIEKTMGALAAQIRDFSLDARDRSQSMSVISVLAQECSDAIGEARASEFAISRQREQHRHDGVKDEVPGSTDIATGPSVTSVDNAIDLLLGWLASGEGRTLLNPLYFLAGAAGSGKTHLLLDATARTIADGRPAVFLASAQFGGGLWSSIAEQLGLSQVGGDVLLDAMDAAGEAAALSGRRFVLFIDALNETTAGDFWSTHLPALRAAVERRTHLALVVSCRDTYVELVADEEERRHYVAQVHPGFTGREYEAAAKYFAHHGLEAPRFPILTPEFTLPLFLRVFCEAMKDAGVTEARHESRTRVFERYLASKRKRVARKALDGIATDFELRTEMQLVSNVLDSLVGRLADTGRERLDVSEALGIIGETLGDGRRAATRLLGILQDEGVLTRERVWDGEHAATEAVRVVFQAFSDFLILRHRLQRSEDPLADDEFLGWLRDEASLGVLDAAAVTLPERFGRELTDVLGVDMATLQKQYRAARGPDRRAFRRGTGAVESFLRSIPHRSTESVTERTIEVLNEARRFISARSFFRTMFLVAPQPDNLLNAERLHAMLARIPMASRDRFFGFATYNEIYDDEASTTRLARWAAAGPYPTYDARVVELAAIPLCWLLGTPHRAQRDWISKSLAQLLSGHLDVAARLITRFLRIDDPYIIQRLVVIGYGALLRAPADAPHAADLVRAVSDDVLKPPVPADEPLLDAARGIVRLGVGRGLAHADALARSLPPYGLKPPHKNVPSEATFEAKYGAWEDIPREESWRSIYGSILSMGDFGRYVIEYVAEQFSSTPLGQPHPEIAERDERFLNRAAWRRFLRALDREQRAHVPEGDEPDLLWLIRIRSELSLTPEQEALLAHVHRRPRARREPRDTRASLARRWVMWRTVSLGWTPAAFAEEDRELSYSNSSRGEHKRERWGKKYQWIALHEYTARMADNYRLREEEWRSFPKSRDLDPTLRPRPYDEFAGDEDADPSPAWMPPAITVERWPVPEITFQRYNNDITAFVADTGTEPTLDAMIRVTGTDGARWLVLGGNVGQTDPDAVRERAGLQQSAFVHSWMVPKGAGKTLTRMLAETGGPDALDLPNGTGHDGCCFLREIGAMETGCYHRHASLGVYGRQSRRVAAVPTVERYSWGGRGLDCSIDDTVSLVLPSTYLQSASAATFTDAGPSWVDDAGTVLYQFQWIAHRAARGLLVRETHLTELLDQRGLELVVWGWMERMNMRSGPQMSRQRDPWVKVKYNAWLGSTLKLRNPSATRQEGVFDANY
ncbi:hypothetical protein [Microbacterium arborescens]|uniref:hypothetical protein n=1 Tax=Microbacterium arborescens TaxID=33883 RepID=UPI00277E25AB|nr:hypothetical protein [Microbacterium arborescens]MDQ1215822.1 hypothetical protein [Microbacterium arborescens]